MMTGLLRLRWRSLLPVLSGSPEWFTRVGRQPVHTFSVSMRLGIFRWTRRNPFGRALFVTRRYCTTILLLMGKAWWIASMFIVKPVVETHEMISCRGNDRNLWISCCRYFVEIIKELKGQSVTDIEINADGTWSPIEVEKESAPEVRISFCFMQLFSCFRF